MSVTREELSAVILRLASRGWCQATAGNFSCRLSSTPLRVLMTPSGIDKSAVSPEMLVELDAVGHILYGAGKPSAEFPLHEVIYRMRTEIGAVLHVHTVYNTILSRRYEQSGQIILEGFEMLKALSGVTTHEHREVIPILPNNQSMPPLAAALEGILKQSPPIHGFLLAGHGLYTLGKDLAEAQRHLEALEFLFEVLYRSGEKE